MSIMMNKMAAYEDASFFFSKEEAIVSAVMHSSLNFGCKMHKLIWKNFKLVLNEKKIREIDKIFFPIWIFYGNFFFREIYIFFPIWIFHEKFFREIDKIFFPMSILRFFDPKQSTVLLRRASLPEKEDKI